MVGGPEKFSLAVDDANGGNRKLQDHVVLAQYLSPVDGPKPGPPTADDPDEANWRLHYGDHGAFRVGQQPPGKIKTDPGAEAPPAQPAQPGATAANPPERGGFKPLPNTKVAEPIDPNRNGKRDPNDPDWLRDQGVQPVQVAKNTKVPPIPESEFWKRQDNLISHTGMQYGHAYQQDKVAMAAGVSGAVGEWTALGLNRRADSILSERARQLAEGSKDAPSIRQNWAQNWHNNWDRVGRVDLAYQKSVAANQTRANELTNEAEHVKALFDDWKGRTVGSPPTQRLADYLEELNKGRSQPLQIGDNEFNQALVQRQKDAVENLTKFGEDQTVLNKFRASEMAAAQRQWGQGGAIRAVGMVGAGLLIDHYMDRAFNTGYDHHNGLSSPYGAVSIPLAIAWNPLAGPEASTARKATGFLLTTAALSASAYALGKMIDPTGSKEMHTSDQWNPNTIDVVGMGFAAGLPTPNAKNRLALAAGTYLEGRSLAANSHATGVGALDLGITIGEKVAWTGLAALTVLPLAKGVRGPAIAFHAGAFAWSVADGLFGSHEDNKQANADAWDALKADQTKRTASSLNTAIDDFAKPAVSNQTDKDGPLFQYFDKWRSKATPFPEPDKGGDLLRERGTIILGTALGEARLANGSARLQPGYHLEYIPGLNGLNLDFGGYAAAYLENAKQSTDLAAKETQRLAAKDGKTVDQSELDGLSAAKDRINKSLDKIYGPTTTHDIPKAFDVLTDYIKNNPSDAYTQWMNHIRDNRIVPLMSQPGYEKDPAARKLVAKALRDEALLFMAWANKMHGPHPDDFHNDVQANMMLTSANTNPAAYLRMANRLDPNNPDLPQYQAIYNDLVRQTRLGAQESLTNDNSANAWMIDQNQILNPGGRQ